MARRVFFSFHWADDVWRVNQIRHSWLTAPDRQTAGFWDAATIEEVKRNDEGAIRRWINGQLEGTSVTVVLVGANTASRPWVIYEIQQSVARGNGILAIRIHNMYDQHQQVTYAGENPLAKLWFTGTNERLDTHYPIYDWIMDNGRENLGTWVEAAARRAGR